MRNILHIALSEHLEQHTNDREKLNEYYQAFKDSEESTGEALALYADLLFCFGVDEDSLTSHVNGQTLIGAGLVLKSLCYELELAQFGRTYTSEALDVLIQGGENGQ